MQVTVSLKNPPSGANKWQIIVADWDIAYGLSWGAAARGNLAEAAIFEIPSGWKLPLRVVIGIYYQWQEAGEWHSRQLYRVQSLHPYLWDWKTGEYTSDPDPTYRDIFIPSYGSYYFNVATEQFEQIEEFAGTISRKELQYDSIVGPIPVY
ncbi:hypothetical protein ES703_94842 [subsurface metagenome]